LLPDTPTACLLLLLLLEQLHAEAAGGHDVGASPCMLGVCGWQRLTWGTCD
jgi:hypothetical protein